MFATMQLYFVLLALLQHAVCAQYPMDATELHLALQTKPLNAWIESIAAKRQISKDAVRSNVRAMRYYLGPESQSPNHTAAAGGGEHAQLGRRQPVLPRVGYPYTHGAEEKNDGLTIDRIHALSVRCRQHIDQPPGSPYEPLDGIHSFWRAGRGGCRNKGKTVKVICKLPREFAPRGWLENYERNTGQLDFPCEKDHVCKTFEAYPFPLPAGTVKFGDCIKEETTKTKTVVHNVPVWSDKVPAPMSPGTRSTWELYGASNDQLNLDWAVYSGLANENLWTSYQTNTFLYNRDVEWRSKDPDYHPWLKMSRTGSPVTVSLYSYLV